MIHISSPAYYSIRPSDCHSYRIILPTEMHYLDCSIQRVPEDFIAKADTEKRITHQVYGDEVFDPNRCRVNPNYC